MNLARIERQRPGNAQIRRGNGSDTWVYSIDNNMETTEDREVLSGINIQLQDGESASRRLLRLNS